MKIRRIAMASGVLLVALRMAQAGTVSRFEDRGFRSIESGEKVMVSGERGAAVRELQEALRDMGFGILDCDGKFGNETENALKDYQAHLGFPETGVLDRRTLAVMEMQAPPPGLKLWEMERPQMIPDPRILVEGKETVARVVVVTNERRTFLFSNGGKLLGIFPDAVGRDESPTQEGLRIIAGKLDQEETERRGLRTHWKDSRVFGVRLLDLWEKDPVTGKEADIPQELHGTFDQASIGTAASHGCMRHYNNDIVRIYDSVSVGDRVVVQEDWRRNALAGQSRTVAGR